MPNDKIQPTNSQFVLYQDDNGVTNVNVRFDGQDVWLSQQQIAMLFDTTQQNISLHINGIIDEGELSKEATHKNFLLVRNEGNRSVKRQIEHYNLDMIIAIGYRVKSQVATRFRQWATQRLHEYIQKGFTMDDECLKGNGNRYFREGLIDIINGSSSSRYNSFFTNIGKVNDVMNTLVTSRCGEVIQIDGADDLFTELYEQVTALEQSNVSRNLSHDMVMARAKKYLSAELYNIEYSDLIEKLGIEAYDKIRPIIISTSPQKNFPLI
jgi:hypothetical protein